MSSRIAALALAAALGLAGSAASAGGAPVFSPDEISMIQDYYATYGADNPAGGKHKSKPLPPGIAKNLARGKPLPPGIAKQQLPQDLQRMLPPVPTGYERIAVDGRVLLVEIATQVIADVILEAVTR
ncbi:MAG: anti-virulence regulator CigR family protein [Steroidobacteraceae bacterium]